MAGQNLLRFSFHHFTKMFSQCAAQAYAKTSTYNFYAAVNEAEMIKKTVYSQCTPICSITICVLSGNRNVPKRH